LNSEKQLVCFKVLRRLATDSMLTVENERFYRFASVSFQGVNQHQSKSGSWNQGWFNASVAD